MSKELYYFPELLLLLFTCMVILVVMHKIKLSPVLGYLIAGSAIGQHGFHLIQNTELVDSFAEFGIIFLIFVIGLELTFERIVKMRLHVFGFGSLQIILTTLSLVFFLTKFTKLPSIVACIISVALSLSSTAIVMQVLAENKRQATQVGRLSLSVLLMQDFVVVPLLAILPLLTKQNEHIVSAIWLQVLQALAAIIILTVTGRLFLRPLFSLIGNVKKDELYVMTALLIVLGSSWVTGVVLNSSTAMGAFLAGLLIAETQYRNKIEDSVIPFQGLFMALFFLSVGMSIDMQNIVRNFQQVLLYSFGLIFIKSLIVFILCRSFKFSRGSSIHSGLLLSQASEFAFILFGLAGKNHIISENLEQLLMMVTAFSMAATPLLSIIGTKLEYVLDGKEEVDINLEFKGVSDLSSHVIIAGFGRVGRTVAYMLMQEQIDYVALDNDVDAVKRIRAQGFPVYHGDITDPEVFKSVGIKRAVAVVVTMDSDRSILNKTVRILSTEFKNVEIVVLVDDYRHGKGLRRLGADITVPTTIEVGLQLGGAVLKDLAVPEHEIVSIKEKMRKDHYSLVEEIELFKGTV